MMTSEGAALYNNLGNDQPFNQFHYDNQESYYNMIPVQEFQYSHSNGYLPETPSVPYYTHEMNLNPVYQTSMYNESYPYQYSRGGLPQYNTAYGAIQRQPNYPFANSNYQMNYSHVRNGRQIRSNHSQMALNNDYRQTNQRNGNNAINTYSCNRNNRVNRFRPRTIFDHPLMDTYEYSLFCSVCFPLHADYSFTVHRCKRNILAFVEKGTPYWYRVREYINCEGSFNIPKPCDSSCCSSSGIYHYNEERCVFAHNKVEIKLWQEEIKGNFNVREFIEKQRKTICDINSIISTYGQIFEFICRICFKRKDICKENSDNPHHCNGSISHYWEDSKILRCVTQSGMCMIKKPVNVKKDAFYLICNSTSFCEKRNCSYAHSEVERDIWRLERDQGFTQERLVLFSKDLQCRIPSGGNNELPTMFYIGMYDFLDIPTRSRDTESNHNNILLLRSNYISPNNTVHQTSSTSTPRNRDYSKSSDVLSRETLHRIPTSASRDGNTNGPCIGFNNGSLSSSCEYRLNNGASVRSNELSLPQVTLLRRTPSCREGATNDTCTESNNDTSHKTVYEMTSSTGNGEHMEPNVVLPNVIVRRRLSSVVEDNLTKNMNTNDRLLGTSVIQKSPSSTKNIAINNECVVPTYTIHHVPVVSCGTISLQDIQNNFAAMDQNGVLPDISVVEQLSSESEDALCNPEDIIVSRDNSSCLTVSEESLSESEDGCCDNIFTVANLIYQKSSSESQDSDEDNSAVSHGDDNYEIVREQDVSKWFTTDVAKYIQWNCRPPIWSSAKEADISICESHLKGEQCKYSHVRDLYNKCVYAHNTDEITEWNQRKEWEVLLLNLVKNSDCKNRRELNKLFCPRLETVVFFHPEVTIEITNNNSVIYSNKRFVNLCWFVNIECQNYNLEEVTMVYNQDRLYFTMEGSVSDDLCALQSAKGNCFQVKPGTWVVNLYFWGNSYGSYMQRVMFDFGAGIFIYRDFHVYVSNIKEYTVDDYQREILECNVLTQQNKETVTSIGRTDLDTKLLATYRIPGNIISLAKQGTNKRMINRYNYVHVMHQLLYEEEYACNTILSSLSKRTVVFMVPNPHQNINDTDQDTSSLYGKLMLPFAVSHSSEVGHLFLTKCSTVLISLDNLYSNKVYEVEILVEETRKQEMVNSIYIRFRRQSMELRNLSENGEYVVNAYFQVDREEFCRMHRAIDQLISTDIVYPDISRYHDEQRMLNMNYSTICSVEPHEQILQYIEKPASEYMVPFLVEGPWGSGKTDLIRETVQQLLLKRPASNILICVGSHRTAEYIAKELQRTILHREADKLLYIHTAERTTLFGDSGGLRCKFLSDTKIFEDPSSRHIVLESVIVLTTQEASYSLLQLELRDHFTHIYVDEADQGLECMSIIPLTMATERTHVIILGDTCQIKPKLYSSIDGIGSLFQRFVEYYDNIPGSNTLRVSLNTIHRTSEDIGHIISELFYQTAMNKIHMFPSKTTKAGFVSLEKSSHKMSAFCTTINSLITGLTEHGGYISDNDVAVVTTYRSQVKYLQESLCNVNTPYVKVEFAQDITNTEYKIVILCTISIDEFDYEESKSTEKNTENIGNYCLLKDERLLHTVMTRAKYAIVVVGETSLIETLAETCDVWKRYVALCSQQTNSGNMIGGQA